MSKILIIDDDPAGTGLLITLLGFEGYQGVAPENWADLVQDIDRERPDLVMMDVRLMSRDGVEVLRRLRAHPDPDLASTPVLMMSAEDQSTRCRDAGANGFIEKPFDRVKLLDTIERILEGSLEEN
ncbi:MAG TPA: response regulator [Alphaproteobacteria bacterium]|nr:response regulator [Alphaproteobacteria bacterium]